MELITYHYTEVDKVFIPDDIDVRVYLVGDEEGPEFHVYLENEYLWTTIKSKETGR